MRILTPAAAEASSLDSTPVDVTVHDVRFSQIWSGIDKLLLESQKYLDGQVRTYVAPTFRQTGLQKLCYTKVISCSKKLPLFRFSLQNLKVSDTTQYLEGDHLNDYSN